VFMGLGGGQRPLAGREDGENQTMESRWFSALVLASPMLAAGMIVAVLLVVQGPLRLLFLAPFGFCLLLALAGESRFGVTARMRELRNRSRPRATARRRSA
jgi:hypothetical protein